MFADQLTMLNIQLVDMNKQLQLEREEMQQQIDNLNKKHLQTLEEERAVVTLKYEETIENLRRTHLENVEQIKKDHSGQRALEINV